jgi:hypothetical protein
MSRAAQKFRQTDVARAIKAVRTAGESTEIDRDGRIVSTASSGPKASCH